MRKVLALVLAIALCLSIVACGNNEKPNDDTSNNNSPTNQTEKEPNNNQVDAPYEGDADLPGRIRVNLSTVKYCVDAPGTLSQRANTGHIVEMGSYFVIYDQYVDISSAGQFEVKLDQISSPKDVIAGMATQMAATAQNGLIFADNYTVEVVKTEDANVNSWNMSKATGKINLTCEYPLDYESVDFVAYSLIKDGYPVYFAVIENPAGEGTPDLDAMAEKIAKTFREYSED